VFSGGYPSAHIAPVSWLTDGLVLFSMPDGRRRTCRVCGVHDSEAGPISWRGKCSVCGPAIFEANCDDLHYHRGPHFLEWRRAMALSVGALLIDDVLDNE
jgi:hypothetical protein